MTRQDVNKLLELPVNDRFELAQLLWESVEEEQWSVPVTTEERRLLDQSLDRYAEDPKAGSTWPEVKARLLERL